MSRSVRQPSQDGVERLLALDTGQGGAEAEMRGVPEGEVTVVGRRMSNRSGSGKRSGSRLAAAMTAMTACPCRMGLPPSSRSVGRQPRRCAGWGSRSAAAPRPRTATSEGSSRSRASSSGWRSSVSSPLPIRLVVVSWPPTIVTMQLATTSSSVSRSPSISAVISAWTGLRAAPVRSARDRVVEVRPSSPRRCCSTRATRSGLCWKLPSISAKSADQRLELLVVRRPGRPSISAVTIAGSGSAKIGDHVHAPRPAATASSSAVGDLLDVVAQDLHPARA